MDNRIQHFSHHHRLTLSLDADKECRICELDCKGLAYSCKGCHFDIHKTCAELPQLINHHPFHPQHPLTLLVRPSNSLEESQCHACGKRAYWSSTYHCSQCEFDLDLNCSALMPTKRTTDHDVVKPHPHPHPLILCETENKIDFYCSGCKLVIENGSIYVCIQCKTILHKSCSQLPHFIKHPFHPNHTLTLLPRAPYSLGEFGCDACGEVHEGLTFHCSECQFDLDINCAFLMAVSEHQIDHHPHPLILCKSSTSSKTKNNKISFVCGACQLPFDDDDDGSSMYCCLDCSLLLHKSCTELPDEIQHPLHPNHPLKPKKNGLLDYGTPKFECMACLRKSKGLSYECRDCKLSIDIPCALSTSLLVNSQLHDHPLAFFSFVAKDLQCNICHHIRKKSPYFRCVACNFNVHIYCVPKLPPTASDGNHRHPLTLTKSLVKDYEDEGEDAEFYCDRCENKRSLGDPTYYCAKCHYVAHVHCVIKEVVRFMEEEWSLAQKLGDKKLDTSIDSCQENSKELVSRVFIKEEEETTRPVLTNFNLHKHPLTFFRDVVDDLSCIVCNLDSHSNFFRCVPCNFNLHLLCIFKLPPTIFHEDHLHTLTLSNSWLEDCFDYTKEAMGQCQVCQKERQLYEPMYYSEQCLWAAHIRCSIPELAMDEEGSSAHKLGDTNLAPSSTSIEENTTKEVLAMDEEGSLAHKLGGTKFASSSTSFELDTNQMVREVLINFSDFYVRHDDQEEAIAAIHIKIKKEKEKLHALRKKYVLEQELKVDALWKRVEALEKHDA